MFIALFVRDGSSHILCYRTLNGDYRSLCGRALSKKDCVNTIGCDSTFNGLCRYCKEYHEEGYEAALEYDPSLARNKLQNRLKDIPFYQKAGIQGHIARNYSALVYREWPTLSKYRRKIIRKTSRKKKYNIFDM